MNYQFTTFYGKNEILYNVVFTNRKTVCFKVYPSGKITAFTPKNFDYKSLRDIALSKAQDLFGQQLLYSILYPFDNGEFIFLHDAVK
ncbi:hypothetical protein IL45_04760 [Nonlabens ulvanivorans]|uniref:Uncharacterized protein n=2 Tax=Nonlabens ulvanivorans TaxID=906888 RepID=A0A084JX43_NONUL|nr:hypothetical protein IL45_04760 [Nonlabens ulvanivorans]